MHHDLTCAQDMSDKARHTRQMSGGAANGGGVTLRQAEREMASVMRTITRAQEEKSSVSTLHTPTPDHAASLYALPCPAPHLACALCTVARRETWRRTPERAVSDAWSTDARLGAREHDRIQCTLPRTTAAVSLPFPFPPAAALTFLLALSLSRPL